MTGHHGYIGSSATASRPDSLSSPAHPVRASRSCAPHGRRARGTTSRGGPVPGAAAARLGSTSGASRPWYTGDAFCAELIAGWWHTIILEPPVQKLGVRWE